MQINVQNITAVILAGGKGSRLGGVDKGWVELRQVPLIQHVINRIQPQVAGIIISANRNIKRYTDLGFPVYEDETNNFFGPLAGILKALQQCKSDWLLTVAADSPFIPKNLAQHLSQNIGEKKLSWRMMENVYNLLLL